MAGCHTHAALLGVAAVSAAPTKHSCTNINYPTEFTEFTEFSGCVYSPRSRFCGFCEFCGRTLRDLKICGNLWNLWENILRQKLLWILRILWENWQRAAWVWQDAIPSYENSHRLHGCAQIKRQKRNLKICGHLWNLWENILRQKLLWASVKSVGGLQRVAWVWQDAIPS